MLPSSNMHYKLAMAHYGWCKAVVSCRPCSNLVAFDPLPVHAIKIMYCTQYVHYIENTCTFTMQIHSKYIPVTFEVKIICICSEAHLKNLTPF